MTGNPKATRQTAEAKFAATSKKAAQAMTERDRAKREIAARTAKTCALRLARDKAERLAAEAEATANSKP